MEQDAIVIKPEEKNSKQKIATIIASTMAVCGIGFGVYGVVQTLQQSNQISDLKSQIENLEKDTGGKTATSEKTDDYIYIGEWGLKIKIPEELIYLDYQMSHASSASTLCLNGGESQDKNASATGGPLNIEVMSLGCITRDFNKTGDFSIGNYSFWYTPYQGEIPSEFANSSSFKEFLERNEKTIKAMLTNPENYSAI